MIYNTLVVGLGQIGMDYDFDVSPNELITTHAQALDFHNGFNLAGGVDVDEQTRQRFTEKFGKPVFSNHIDALKELQVDIAVISVPTEFHLTILEDILREHSPKIILVEKPLSYRIFEAKKILEIAALKNQNIAVNYFREYEPIYNDISSKIKDGLIGFPLKFVVHYTKGIINNGSHFIKYISNIMGNFINLKIIEKGRLWNDIDPEPDIRINFDKGVVYFIAHKEENYSHYEMEMIGPKGKLRFSNLGSTIEHWHVVDDPDYKGYRILSDEPHVHHPGIKKYQLYVYENIYNYLVGKAELCCSAKSMNGTINIYERIEKALADA